MEKRASDRREALAKRQAIRRRKKRAKRKGISKKLPEGWKVVMRASPFVLKGTGDSSYMSYEAMEEGLAVSLEDGQDGPKAVYASIKDVEKFLEKELPVNEDSGEKVLPEEWTYDYPQERVYVKEEDGTKLYSMEAVEKNVGHELDYETMSESSSEESSDDSSDEADAELESFKKKNAPKKPLSAYILFSQSVRAKVKEECAHLDNKKILGEIGKRWRELSNEDKQPFIAVAAAARPAYEAAKREYEEGPLKEFMAAWRLKWGREETSSEESSSEEESSSSEEEDSEEEIRKWKKKNGPKAPMSSFMMYSVDARAKAKKEHPELQPKDVLRFVAVQWKELPSELKQPYVERANAARAAHAIKKKEFVDGALKEYLAGRKRNKGTNSSGSSGDESSDSETDDEGKIKKWKRDNAPKRPQSAYIRYCVKARKSVSQANPELKAKQIMSIVANKWKTLSAEEREPYIVSAAADKEKYLIAKKEFEEGPLKEYLASKSDILEDAKELAAFKRKNAPKPPPSSFTMFSRHMRKTVISENPGVKGKDFRNKMAEIWKSLDDDRRALYQEKERLQRQIYTQQKKEFEEGPLKEYLANRSARRAEAKAKASSAAGNSDESAERDGASEERAPVTAGSSEVGEGGESHTGNEDGAVEASAVSLNPSHTGSHQSVERAPSIVQFADDASSVSSKRPRDEEIEHEEDAAKRTKMEPTDG
eukprot:g579.t1